MKIERDNNKSDKAIERIFKKVIEKYPEDFEFVVENTRFIFTRRDKPLYDEEGQQVAAFASKVSNRERDIYGTDFEICVYSALWDEMDEKQRMRLIYHELLHCRVWEDEEDPGSPLYDNDDRVSIYIEPHDLIIKTFKREIERFGLQRYDLDVAKFLYLAYKRLREKRKERLGKE